MEVNSANYLKVDVMKAREAMIRLRNLSILMKLLFQSPSEIMMDRKCTLDEALEQQEKAYNYVKKYGVLHSKDAVEKAKPIVDQLLFDIIQEEKQKETQYER
jgi:hypothetical protein